MNLDPRIIEGKRVLTPFDIREAEQFDGRSGYFSNVTDDFRHLENAAYGVLNLTFGQTPYRYIDDEGESKENEELTEIEKAIQENGQRIINEQLGKKLTEKGYSSKTVGAFTFYIKTREEYTAALRQTLAFAENMAESAVRDRKKDGDFLQFISMTMLYLSDLLEKVEAEDKKDNENNA